MNLINMSDRDKLHYYAKNYSRCRLRILSCHEKSDSYYHDSGKSDGIHDVAIMEYDIERYDVLKKILIEMWSDVDFINSEQLATMVSAMILKNMPQKIQTESQEKYDKSQNYMIKESYESVNEGNAPPVFVYEF